MYRIRISHKGSFKNINEFFKRMSERDSTGIYNTYGRIGVEALRNATPVDTGTTAGSWSYEIVQNEGSTSIAWTNSNINDGCPIAIILQYGHATKNGGYVQGIDYINPALKPIFEQMADSLWEEVVS